MPNVIQAAYRKVFMLCPWIRYPFAPNTPPLSVAARSRTRRVAASSPIPYWFVQSSSGVVDPDLKVYIVDAAVIMPRIPAAHTQAPTYVITANLIKEARDCY